MKVIPSPDDATLPHSLPNGANGRPDSERIFRPFQCLTPTPPHPPTPHPTTPHVCEIQMPSPSARRAPGRPNKSGGVVYRELLNINLAEPAAVAAVCRGMTVITQTDKHTHTHKRLVRDHTVQSHTQTRFFFNDKYTEATLSCVCYMMMLLMIFASCYPSSPLPCFLLISPPSHFCSAKPSLLLNFIMKPCFAPTALVASKYTHTYAHTDLHANTRASSSTIRTWHPEQQLSGKEIPKRKKNGILLCAEIKEI